MALNTRTDEHVSLLHQVYGIAGRDRLCVVAAAGFRLDDGTAGLLTDQELWAAAAESLGPTDVLDPASPKRFSEVLVAGKCYATGGQPAPVVGVTLKVGPVSKELAVFGKRSYLPGGRLGPPEPFAEMPMGWDRTFGGPGLKNPEGCTHPAQDAEPAAPPNVEYRNQIMVMKNDQTEPAGLGPIGWAWPERLVDRGTFDDEWLETCWPGLPKDFDLGYFNMAPEDQRFTGRFEPGQQVEISGMNADHPRISASLPMIRVRVFAVRQDPNEGETFTELSLTPDTLWLFPNALVGVVIYRGRLPVADDEASDVSYVVGGHELLSEPEKPISYYRELVDGESEPVEAPLPPPPEPPADEAPAAPPPLMDLDSGLAPVQDYLVGLQARIAEMELQLDGMYKAAGVNPAALEAELASILASLPVELLKASEPVLPSGPESMLEDLLASNKAKEAELAAKLKGLGIDPSSPPPLGPTPEPGPRNGAEAVDYLKSKGVKDEKLFDALRRLDDEVAAAEREKNALIAASDPEGAAKAGLSPAVSPGVEATQAETPEAGKGMEPPKAPGASGDEEAPPAGPLTPDEVEEWARGERSMAGCDLAGFDLSGRDLKGADFTGAMLEGADLSDADLTGATLDGAKLADADLSMAQMKNVRGRNAVFAGAKLHQAQLNWSDFEQSDFTGADMSRSVCSHSNFSQADLSEANLQHAEAQHIKARAAVFNKVDMSNALFTQANLEEADLDGAHLKETGFLRANLKDARLGDVDAESADFSDASMEKCRADGEARFTKAFFTNTSLDDAAWDRVDASGADFRSSRLNRASMEGCCFSGANMEQMRARNGDFSKVDFTNASLKQADLFQSSLRKAVLLNTNLGSSNLYGVDLYKIVVAARTNFDGANLRGTLLKDRRLP